VSETTVERRAEVHHGNRDVSGGWLRPAVFGARDGLVSNVALIAGVAAAAGITYGVGSLFGVGLS
jgi:VIT1/CCC1 family predicted Fe2+/Mn2+ transporter